MCEAAWCIDKSYITCMIMVDYAMVVLKASLKPV